jgi:RecB family exonuclease
MHRALAEWVRSPLLGADVFDHVFEEECSRRRIPRDYRTEAVRLEMLRNFTAFMADPEARMAGWSSRAEQDFEFALFPGLAIRGRIDRLEENGRGEALVIDYKYSAPERVRKKAAKGVQGGLYSLAAERQFHLKPVGMEFWGLRKEISRWPAASNRDELRALMRAAEQTAKDVHERILSGRIAVDPADPDECKWCDYRDACRVETLPAVRGAGS